MRMFLIAVLVIHLAITLWSLRDSGYFAPFPPFSEDYIYQIFSDLGAALLIGLLFLYSEVRRQKKSMGGFVFMLVMTLAIGSFSPLVFLILNPKLLPTNNSN